MIYTDRSDVAPPEELLYAAEKDAREAKVYFADLERVRHSTPFPFMAYLTSGVKEALHELFHGKCAFCESKLNKSKSWEVEQFRPTNMAVNYDGAISRPGYWWLAWEWSNFYPICMQCASIKASRFPVVGRRAVFVDIGTREAAFRARTGINAIAVSADGKTLVTFTENLFEFWDLPARRKHDTTVVEDGLLVQVAVSEDLRTVVATTIDGRLIVWQFSPKFALRNKQQLGHIEEPIHDVVISPNGRFVAVANAAGISVWDVEHNKQIDQKDIDAGRITVLAIARDGQKIVFGRDDEKLGSWNRETGDVLFETVDDAYFTDMRLTNDESKIISLSGNGVIQMWDAATSAELFRVEYPVSAEKLAISHDGRFAVCLGDSGVGVVDLFKRRFLTAIHTLGLKVSDIAVTGDGRYLVAAEQGGMASLWTLDTIVDERALLIDPCQFEPANYLVFNEDGYVASVPPDSKSLVEQDGDRFNGMDRGQLTIDTFGLNRIELVRERKQAAKMLRAQVNNAAAGINITDLNPEDGLAEINELMSSKHPYAAMRRQLIPKFINEKVRPPAKGIDPRVIAASDAEGEVVLGDSISFEVSVGGDSIDFGQTTGVESNIFEQKISKYAVDNSIFDSAFENLETTTLARKVADMEEGQSDLVGRSALISRVEIKNFRSLEDLSFNFGGGTGGKVGWKVILGENGVGKSSVLQAVGLTVMGRRRLKELAGANGNGEANLKGNKLIPDVRMENLLRRGAEEGSVKVYFSTDTEPVELRLTKDGPDFEGAEPTLRTYLLGFGSARWLPRAGSRPPEEDQFVRIRNLFNPFVPLTDAIPWLVKLKRSREIKKYQAVERTLARLLQLDLATRFPMRKHPQSGEDVIYVQRPGIPVRKADRLDQLSDGYQTILAIAVAILDMVGEEWDMELELAEGLVLLDEIGSHLHPRWKLRIVESLRTAFPRMQFLSATHEPLCLRGLYDNEIMVLARNEDRQLIVKDNIPSPNTYTVDQLLRSPLFGMLTTFDPDTERDFERYYEILSKPENVRQDDEQAELVELRERIGKQGVLGEMTRRQIASSVMDEKMQEAQKQKSLESFDAQALTDETKDEIAGMWAEIFSE